MKKMFAVRAVRAMIEAEAKGNSFLLFGVSQDKLFENICWYDD